MLILDPPSGNAAVVPTEAIDGIAAPETGKEDEKETLSKPIFRFGSYIRGKWYCECNILAKCRPVIREDSPNKGRKFWSCNKPEDERHNQCRFFLWDDDEPQARDAREKLGPPPPQPEKEVIPKTPKRKRETAAAEKLNSDINPFSLSKGKRGSRESSDEKSGSEDPKDDSDGVQSHTQQTNAIASSSRNKKKARFEDGLRIGPIALPTPDTGERSMNEVWASEIRERQASPTPAGRPRDKGKGKAPLLQISDSDDDDLEEISATQFRERWLSSTPSGSNRIIGSRPKRAANLAARIFDLVREDLGTIKESTETQIEHEILEELDVSEARMRSYEEIMSKQRKDNIELKKRNAELEALAGHLADAVLPDNIQLSD